VVGKTLGHYEIIEPLGAGGMGEVYRARDTKLERDVAIKVLPAHLADDAERLARMQREAQLLAALNHPNIAAIYGLEEADDISFLAMELAAGQTLAQRLTDGALSIDESLKIALQIAEALEAAHERGIVHRDLKPANIQVATEGSAAGQVKVLDFGLAKAYEADGASAEMSPDLSASPTMAAATRTGVIMGTAAFMSPEQARGKPLEGAAVGSAAAGHPAAHPRFAETVPEKTARRTAARCGRMSHRGKGVPGRPRGREEAGVGKRGGHNGPRYPLDGGRAPRRGARAADSSRGLGCRGSRSRRSGTSRPLRY